MARFSGVPGIIAENSGFTFPAGGYSDMASALGFQASEHLRGRRRERAALRVFQARNCRSSGYR